MKKPGLFRRIPENAVFWLLLFSLAAGSAISLHEKITGRTEVPASGRVLSPVHPAASPSAIAEGPLLSPAELGLTLESLQGQETLFFQPGIFP